MTDPTPLVGVVVVNYDGGDLTVRCVDSVLALDWPADRLRVVLVDNASSDGVAEKLEGRDPRLTVLRSELNLGFAGGCNAGIRADRPRHDGRTGAKDHRCLVIGCEQQARFAGTCRPRDRHAHQRRAR